MGLQYEAHDLVQRMRGVGGAEFVFIKRIERLSVGELQVSDFDMEVGAMDYGFAIDGMIGTDFLWQVGAVMDLAHLEIQRASPSCPSARAHKARQVRSVSFSPTVSRR